MVLCMTSLWKWSQLITSSCIDSFTHQHIAFLESTILTLIKLYSVSHSVEKPQSMSIWLLLPLPLHEWNRTIISKQYAEQILKKLHPDAIRVSCDARLCHLRAQLFFTKDPEHFAFTMCESAVQPWCSALIWTYDVHAHIHLSPAKTKGKKSLTSQAGGHHAETWCLATNSNRRKKTRKGRHPLAASPQDNDLIAHSGPNAESTSF